jgi:hypothetical protein
MVDDKRTPVTPDASPDDLLELAMPVQCDSTFVSSGKKSVLQYLFSAELIASMDKVNFAAEVRQIKCFFNSGIAAAHNDHFFIPVEKPVAGGAGTYPFAHERRFTR